MKTHLIFIKFNYRIKKLFWWSAWDIESCIYDWDNEDDTGDVLNVKIIDFCRDYISASRELIPEKEIQIFIEDLVVL